MADDGAGIEQIFDLAQYIDTINKTNPAQGLSLEIENLVENEQTEDALKKVVEASSALSSAPERGSWLVSPSWRHLESRFFEDVWYANARCRVHPRL
jgi:hypothetical protein